MAILENLPNELLLSIFEELWEIRGLASLAQMNHRLKKLADPILYGIAARKKKHNAFFQCAQFGQMENLEALRKNGQDLRVSISNEKELSKKAKLALNEKKRLDREKAKKLSEMGQETDGDEHEDEDESNLYLPLSTEHGTEMVYTGELDKNPHYRVTNAISIAAVHGQAEVVSWLISHGVGIYAWSVNLCPCQGYDEVEGAYNMDQTPLHLAICHGHYGAAHVLTANGASPECTDADGTSMWHGAISSSHLAPALRFATSVAEAQASVAASFSPVDSVFADFKHQSGRIPLPVDDTHQSAYISTKGTETASQDPSARTPASIFGGDSFGESAAIPTAGDPEIPQPIQPTEDHFIDAVYTMLDPIAAIDAYADSRQTEVRRWQGRKLGLMAAHRFKIVKRPARRARRKRQLLRRIQREANEEAEHQWRCTRRAVHVALARTCLVVLIASTGLGGRIILP